MKFLLLSFLLCLNVFAQELETNSYLTIEKKANEYAKEFNPKDVLIVLDIDNTVLTMPQDLGSDQWFNWQYSNCVKSDKKPSFCVAKNMGELLDINGKLFSLSKMVPTTKNTVEVIKRLQKKNFKVILLTSRGHAFRSATEKVMQENNLNFIDSAIGPKGGYPGTFTPYDVKNLKKYGLTKSDATKAKLKKQGRPISFENGIMMTAGLNKGIMLKTILHKTGYNPKAVIFADDHKRHTKKMNQIHANSSFKLTTYRFGAIDKNVTRFKKSDKKEVIKAQNKLMSTLNSIF